MLFAAVFGPHKCTKYLTRQQWLPSCSNTAAASLMLGSTEADDLKHFQYPHRNQNSTEHQPAPPPLIHSIPHFPALPRKQIKPTTTAKKVQRTNPNHQQLTTMNQANEARAVSTSQPPKQKRRSLRHLEPQQQELVRKQRAVESARKYRLKREAEDRQLEHEYMENERRMEFLQERVREMESELSRR